MEETRPESTNADIVRKVLNGISEEQKELLRAVLMSRIYSDMTNPAQEDAEQLSASFTKYLAALKESLNNIPQMHDGKHVIKPADRNALLNRINVAEAAMGKVLQGTGDAEKKKTGMHRVMKSFEDYMNKSSLPQLLTQATRSYSDVSRVTQRKAPPTEKQRKAPPTEKRKDEAVVKEREKDRSGGANVKRQAAVREEHTPREKRQEMTIEEKREKSRHYDTLTAFCSAKIANVRNRNVQLREDVGAVICVMMVGERDWIADSGQGIKVDALAEALENIAGKGTGRPLSDCAEPKALAKYLTKVRRLDCANGDVKVIEKVLRQLQKQGDITFHTVKISDRRDSGYEYFHPCPNCAKWMTALQFKSYF